MNTAKRMKQAKRERQRKQITQEAARRRADFEYSARKAGMPHDVFALGLALGTHRIERRP